MAAREPNVAWGKSRATYNSRRPLRAIEWRLLAGRSIRSSSRGLARIGSSCTGTGCSGGTARNRIPWRPIRSLGRTRGSHRGSTARRTFDKAFITSRHPFALVDGRVAVRVCCLEIRKISASLSFGQTRRVAGICLLPEIHAIALAHPRAGAR